MEATIRISYRCICILSSTQALLKECMIITSRRNICVFFCFIIIAFCFLPQLLPLMLIGETIFHLLHVPPMAWSMFVKLERIDHSKVSQGIRFVPGTDNYFVCINCQKFHSIKSVWRIYVFNDAILLLGKGVNLDGAILYESQLKALAQSHNTWWSMADLIKYANTWFCENAYMAYVIR